MKEYYVYILASKSRVLYTGVTHDLLERVQQHKDKINEGFTSKYNVNRLVYFEATDDISFAITREKRIKKWKRAWKERLINEQNPKWNDLFYEMIDTS
jgi:putative endonuclease